MYYIVGDFIRLGDTTKDMLHSQIVKFYGKGIVFSINRTSRKLNLHVWQLVQGSDGNTGGKVEPLASVQPDELKAEFMKEERRGKGKRV